MKTIIYIDGYNLYFGCLKHSSYKWLDIYKLFEQIIHIQNPIYSLEKIKYFTADIKVNFSSHGNASQKAQQSYHQALETLYPNKIEIIKGYYTEGKANLPVYQKPVDLTQKSVVWRLEEKQTDVNIALAAYRDAIKQEAEQVIFVSNDTDLEPVLKAIKEDVPGCYIGLILPIRENSSRPPNKRLSDYATWTKNYIKDEELNNNQLPNKIPTRKKAITKPDYW